MSISAETSLIEDTVLVPESEDFNELLYNTGVGFALVAASSSVVMIGAIGGSISRAANRYSVNANLFTTIFGIVSAVVAFYALEPYF
jgi:hypothetical protein